jgi:cell division inhibitor SepF
MANPLRKTMVYLGLADEEYDYDNVAPVAPVAPVQHNPSTSNRAAVTPLRRSAPVRQAGPAEMSEILTVHPRAYKDVKVIAESFRDGIPVIMNLSNMSDADARRLIDFCGGLAEGLHGKIERVTNKVFLLSPAHVAISGDHAEVETDVDAAFYPEQ